MATCNSKHWLGRDRARVFGALVDALGFGPFDGGCVTFAFALRRRYGGEVHVLVRRNGFADHAVLRTGSGLWMDADGPAESLGVLLARFNRNEDARCVDARPFVYGKDLDGAPVDDIVASQIAKMLPSCPGV